MHDTHTYMFCYGLMAYSVLLPRTLHATVSKVYLAKYARPHVQCCQSTKYAVC